MLVLPQKVKVVWTGMNREWYESFGKYGEYKHFKEFEIDVEDVLPTGGALIKVTCDYCNKIVEKITNQRFNAIKEVEKDCCGDFLCQNKKREDVIEVRHGVRNAARMEGIREKAENTLVEKYGITNPMYSQEFKDKIVETNLENLGVEYPMQSEKVREKRTKTYIENYGKEHATQSEEVKSKIRKTNIKRYGFPVTLQNPEIYQKGIDTKYKNSSQVSSRQQRYLHSILGGELNYPYYTASLDIAFPEEKIYLEYDGGGHELSVKLGTETQEEYDNRSRSRWYSLYRNGWKEIRIISLRDKLPSDKKLLLMIEEAREILESGRSWVTFNIDESFIETSKIKENYNFGELRNIYGD